MEHKIRPAHVTVIGGANMDVCGSPKSKLILRDSNPGTVTVKPGGVGRNIAHDLRLLGLDVSLVTALGGDIYGQGLMDSCKKLGMDMSMTLILPHMRSSVYLYLTDADGDMCAAVNDMDIVSCISPVVLAGIMDRINSSDALVLDANLEPETLLYIAENAAVPVYADAVSALKAQRLRPVLPYLRALKLNLHEAEALTGCSVAADALSALLEQGVERVFLSMGLDGILAGSGGERAHIPCEKVPTADTTGAGDAAAAAMVWADIMGLGLKEACIAAVRAGAVTAASPLTNSPALSAESLLLAIGSDNQ